jgi:hypothetical protein
LPLLEALQLEAVRSLADMSTEWTKEGATLGHLMAIDVRDGSGPVLQAKFTSDLERTKH